MLEKHCTNAQPNEQGYSVKLDNYMGIITRHNQTMEDVCARIQFLNELVGVTMDPLEQQEKFD
jgi:hypothetical protein